VQTPVRSQDVARLDVPVPAVRLRDPSSRLADQQRSGGDVPGLEAQFEEHREAARRNVGEVQRGRRHPTDPGRLVHHLAEHLQVPRVARARAGVRNARGDDGPRQIAVAGDAQLLSLEPAAPPFLRHEHLVFGGIMHDAGHQLSLHFERHGHGEMGNAVEEVGRPVQRVDHEARAGIRADGGCALLRQEAVPRIALEEE